MSAELAEPLAARTKRILIGRPRATREMEGTLLTKTLALPIFSSDPISSVAYATEAALAVLVAVSFSLAPPRSPDLVRDLRPASDRRALL